MIASDLIINDNDYDDDDDHDDDNDNDRVISRLYLSFDDSINDNDISFDDSNDDDDDDDDINVKRRRRHKNNDNIIVITLHHHRLTSLQNVGLQIWRATLLLSDYLIYLYYDKSNRVNEKVIVELGCGVGLLSIITSIINDKISSSSSSSSSRIDKAYFTDYKQTIVELSETNAIANSHIIKNSTSDINFRVLDWSVIGFPIMKTDNSDDDDSKYLWTNDDINYILHNDIVYFAADIVYDDTITLNFMTKLNELLKNGIDKCYIALEKRFNFSIDCMDVVANGYDYFLSFLNIDDNNDNNDTNNDNTKNDNTNNDNTNDDNHIKLYAKRVDIDFPQYILNYSRGNDLEIYIVYKK
jgi:hypothetical protein